MNYLHIYLQSNSKTLFLANINHCKIKHNLPVVVFQLKILFAYKLNLIPNFSNAFMEVQQQLVYYCIGDCFKVIIII